MNKRSFLVHLLLFSSLVSVFSCKKEDQVAKHLSGSYVTDTVLAVSAPVMYTKNTLITDSNFIKAYVSRLTNWYPNPFPCTTCSFTFGASSEPATGNVSIDFTSPKEGRVQFSYGSTVNCLVRIENNNAVFISKDTIPFGSGNNPCSQVVNKARLYKAPYDTCRPLSTSTGTSYYCESQPVELVIALNGDLYLPEIKAFTGKTGTSVGSCYSPSQFLNVLNPGLQGSLGTTDTIVVQEKKWKLRKM